MRLGSASSGGSANSCTGVLAFSWDGFQAANPGALGNPWSVGDKVYAQTWYRDPLAARGTNLSNALELTLQPTAPLPCFTPLPGMRLIPSGVFAMGSAEPFASPFPDPARPVENTRWQDARDSCDALTAQQAAIGAVPPGYPYRLPTEAEWEYACRTGTIREFRYGGSLACNQARFAFTYHPPAGNCSVNSTTTVGTYLPNAWGLRDMHGNVSEWRLDAYAAYTPNDVTDPFVSVGVQRVHRGGDWLGTSSNCRSASRARSNPLGIWNNIGFRVSLAPTVNVP